MEVFGIIGNRNIVASVKPVDEDGIGECYKCGAMQDVAESKQATIKGENDRLCLSAFDDIVMKIAELPMEKITMNALIKMDPCDMKFSNGVIYYVYCK